MSKQAKKILYVDMDNVLVDFASGIKRLDSSLIEQYGDDIDDAPGLFALMDPMDGAIDAYISLSNKFDTYILSTAPWKNQTALNDKLKWVKKYLGDYAYKRLILTHHKNLNKGDYLIDDRTKNGAGEFEGEHILFGSEEFPGWDSVLEYLMKAEG